jgi:CRISPR-associated endonuclease Cas1
VEEYNIRIFMKNKNFCTFKKKTSTLYIEYGFCRIERGCLVVSKGEESERFELKKINLVFLSDRCSVTTACLKILTDAGCTVAIDTQDKIPSISFSHKYRNGINKVRQIECHIRPKKRLKVAKKLAKLRNNVLSQMGLISKIKYLECKNINEILSAEGACIKAFYKEISEKYETKEEPEYLMLAHKILYGLCASAIVNMSYEINVGIIHGATNGGGLIFDLSDIFKPLIYEFCLKNSFLDKNDFIKQLLNYFKQNHFNKEMSKILESLFL